MKSSTLHRSNLTKERMSMLENVKFQASRRHSSDNNQYIRVSKANELDVLYRSIGKSLSAGVSAATMYGNRAKTKSDKTPGVYLGMGFLGIIAFVIVVSIIVWISSIPTQKPVSEAPKTSTELEVVTDVKEGTESNRQEKYTIKSGDTLNKIAFRFYGRYDVRKIEEIKRINNIESPEGLQIGQVLIIPLER